MKFLTVVLLFINCYGAVSSGLNCKSFEQFLKRYEVECERELGQGKFGTVWKVWYQEGDFKKTAALKIMTNEEEHRHELDMLQQINSEEIKPTDHHHVNHLIEHAINNAEGSIIAVPAYFLLIEYIMGVPLEKFEIDGKIDDIISAAKGMFEDLSSTLLWLHSFHLYHTDLSPNNIIANQQTYYIIDFGMSRYLEIGQTQSMPWKFTEEYASDALLELARYQYWNGNDKINADLNKILLPVEHNNRRRLARSKFKLAPLEPVNVETTTKDDDDELSKFQFSDAEQLQNTIAEADLYALRAIIIKFIWKQVQKAYPEFQWVQINAMFAKPTRKQFMEQLVNVAESNADSDAVTFIKKLSAD